LGRTVPRAQLTTALLASRGGDIWVARDHQLVARSVLAATAHGRFTTRGPRPHLILMASDPVPLGVPSLEVLRRQFDRIVIHFDMGSSIVPGQMAVRADVSLGDLLEILACDDPGVHVLSATVDRELGIVQLVRGDCSTLVVPLHVFQATAAGVVPDFSRGAVEDCGQTLRFGRYEAAVDRLLYEYDPVYRRRANRNARLHDPGFGAALRRLRLLRGLGQADFAPVPERTIRRLEAITSVQVPTMYAKVRGVLERKLGVSVDTILTF
jgi:hypothetical protein